MNNLPRIEVSFLMDGKEFEPDVLTALLGILPNKVRTLDDWPEAIKNNKEFPIELQPRCVWEMVEKNCSCNQIETPICNIIDRIKGKENLILDFCNENGLEKELCITIHAEAMSMPEIIIPNNIVTYFGKLGVSISFDIYTY